MEVMVKTMMKEIITMCENNRKDILTLREALKELTIATMEMNERLEKLEGVHQVPEHPLTLDGDPDS